MDNHPLIEALARRRLRARLPAPAVRRHLRHSVGMTQVEVAALVGVQPPTVSRWESGVRQPGDAVLPLYLDLLDRFARVAVDVDTP